MFSETHFHSTAHEVLCVASGRARLCFGGKDNPGRQEMEVKKGDVAMVPVGVAHCLLEDLDGGFEIVGSYPPGKQWDMCHGKGSEKEVVKGMARVPWFERDPIHGGEGPVLSAGEEDK